MKSAPRIVVFLTALAIGGLIGWRSHAAFTTNGFPPPLADAPSGNERPEILDPPSSGLASDEHGGFLDQLHGILSNPNRAFRDREIARLARSLDSTEIRDAIARVAQSRIPKRKQILAQLYARWGELEPLVAIEFANSLPRSSERRDAVAAILNGWIEVDPKAAEAWAIALPTGILKATALQSIASAYATDDPLHALELAQHLSAYSWREVSDLGERIFGPWAVRDPAGAAAAAARLAPGALRTEAQNAVAIQWAESDPKSALAWATSLPDLLPSEADGFGGRLTTMGADRSNTTKRIIETWMKRDATAAVAWLADLPNEPWKNVLLIDACSQIADSTRDPHIGFQIANLFPVGGRRNDALHYLAQRIGQFDSDGGLAMLSLAADDAARQSVMSGLAESLKGDALLHALKLAGTNGFSLEHITRWGDPATAVTWAAEQPNNNKYLPQMAGVWMVKSPEQAEAFVQNLPVPLRDAAFARAVQSSFYGPVGPAGLPEKYGRAANWVFEIADPALRDATIRDLARLWLRYEATSARQWLESAPLSSDLKLELLQGSATQRN